MAGGQRNDPRAITAWALYDWANSAYVTTTATALLPAYFAASVVPRAGVEILGRHYDAQTLWAYVLGLTGLLTVAVAPVLGAIADYSASRRRFLRGFALTGAIGASLLALVDEGDIVATIVLFVVAQIGFAGGNVFYDGMLPELTTPDTIDAVSAKGYAYGYVGGGLQFGLALALVVWHAEIGLERRAAVQLALATAGLWWLGFGAVALVLLGNRGPTRVQPSAPAGLARLVTLVRVGIRRSWEVTRELPSFPDLLLFLAAYVLYGNGVQAIMGLASVYAIDTLRLETETVMGILLAVQFVAVAGALAFGRLAMHIGAKRALLVGLACWSMVAVLARGLAPGVTGGFLALGLAVGLVQGGTQSLSRSLYGTMVPEAASAQFFGVFSVFSKLSGAAGPLVFALVSDLTGSVRTALLSLVVFFAGGALLLGLADVEEARRSRHRWRLT